MVEEGKCKKVLDIPSFFMSVAGLYTTGLMYYKCKNDEQGINGMTEKIIRHFEFFENDLGNYAEDELLYGIAGYLYCLLMILQNVDPKHKKALKIINRLIETII